MTVQRLMFVTIALNLGLIAWGLIRFPASLTQGSGWLGVLPALVMQIIYGAAAWFATRRTDARVLTIGLVGGIAFAVIYAGEGLLEYLIQIDEQVSVTLGFVVILLLFTMFFAAGIIGAAQVRRMVSGVQAAVWSAMIGSLLWFAALWIVYYLFYNTPQQERVIHAEGALVDFARSGMTDLRAFVIQDYLGAGFFHLLLAPLLAAILGLIGAFIVRTIPKR